MHRINKKRILHFLEKNIYVVAWIVLITSVIFSIFARSPFGFYDEHVHYIRALGIKNGQMLSYSKVGDEDKLGHDIDKSNLDYTHVYVDSNTNPLSFDWLHDMDGGVKKINERVFEINTSAAPYTPVPYAPHAFGAKIAQVLGLNLRGEFVMMRLMGAVVSLIMVLAAFRVSPRKFKWVILTVSLIPMSIAAFSAISTDGFTIAVSLLFMAIVTNAIAKIQYKNLNNRDILGLGLVSLLVVSAKIPLLLMISMILVLLIVFRKDINKRQRVYLFLILLMAFVVTLLWINYAKDINTGAFWGRNVNTAEQIKYILHHPIVFLKNLIFSALNYDYANIPYLLYANSPSYQSMPFVIDIVIIMGLILSPFVASDNKRLSKTQKKIFWLQVIGAVLMILSIFVLLYLQFTPIGTPNKIEGVQPRYFVPILPLLLINPYSWRLNISWRMFAYLAPFVGVTLYVTYIIVQL